MRDFQSIVVELKAYLSICTGKKVLDKDVADALGISQANFATIKKRKKIPYKNILEFCNKEQLSPSKIFFK